MALVVIPVTILPAPRATAQAHAAPAAAAPIYQETFEHNIPTTPLPLTSYTGFNGETYSADPAYLANCNGDIVNYNMTALPANCNAGPYGMASLRSMAYALGVLEGFPDPSTNNALSAYTDTGNNQARNPCPIPPGSGLDPTYTPPFMCTAPLPVQLQTDEPIGLPGGTPVHFITFGVNVASLVTNAGCYYASPLLQFNLLSDSTLTPVGGLIDPCTDPRSEDVTVPSPLGGTVDVRVGSYVTSAAIALSGTSLRVQLTNAQGTGLGNDAAVDNISILDATPQLTKSFSPNPQVAGLPTRLTFTITNSSDLLAKPGWSFTDTLPSGMTVADPPDESTDCPNSQVRATSGQSPITVTGDLIDGQASCTVSINVTGTPGLYTNGPGNVATSGIYPPPDTPVTFDPPDPRISVTKTPNPDTVHAAGDTVTYEYTVTNDGNVDLSNIDLADVQAPPALGLASPPFCPSATLAVGNSMTCTAAYTVTQADVDHGRVDDTATVTGDPPAVLGLPAVTDTVGATVDIPADPKLTISKTADPDVVSADGEAVTYSFEVTNTGNETIDHIGVGDTSTGTGTPSAVSCGETSLAPGDYTTCTATYSVTQADMDKGVVTDTATAAGTSPSGVPVASAPGSATVTAAQAPELALVKTVSPASPSLFRVGQVVTYSFEVTNTGNVTVTGIGIVESGFSGTGGPLAISCPVTTLAPAESTTCTATYTLTTADIDAGSVTNTALAAGTAPDGAPVDSDPSEAEVTATQDPRLAVVKTGIVSGNVISYRFTVVNTGNTTINGLGIGETSFSGTGTVPAASCTVTTLAPGAETDCFAAYTVTTADRNAAKVTNTAEATGTSPGGVTATSPPSTATVPLTQNPALGITKLVPPDAVTTAGQVVTYRFVVANTGNVTVRDLGIVDTAFTGTGTLSPATCPATPLAPGTSTVCTASYTVTQDDIDTGTVTNSAIAAGTAPDGSTVPSSSATGVLTVAQNPGLTVVKSVSPVSPSLFRAGQVFTYSFEVTNTGNETVNGIRIVETAFSGTGGPPSVTCPVTSLAPGKSTTCTATYTLTTADIDAGKVTDTARAVGLDPHRTRVASLPDSAAVTAAQDPRVALLKTASVSGNVVTYRFTVVNTGNTTIHDPGIRETSFSGTGDVPVATCTLSTLPPGAVTSCTATYTATTADLDAGRITNIAEAIVASPGTLQVTSPEATQTILLPQAPELMLVKSASRSGEVVTYHFRVTNTGNVTVDDIGIGETAFSGTGAPSAVHCPATTLGPGEHVTCTATYTLTNADIDAGHVTNAAVGVGTGRTGLPVISMPSQVRVTATQTPALTLVKTASPSSSLFRAGQVVTYHFAVTNTGNLTVHGTRIDETAFSGTGVLSAITCPVTTLGPGKRTTCTATYHLTRADIAAGKVTNTALASGTLPSGKTVTSRRSTARVTVRKLSIISGVPGNGSGPSAAEIWLGAALILAAAGAAGGLIARRRTAARW